ncbi:MAG: hypothetical protein HUJ76_09445 [Parasporobacterium sp.]|nr:hypothetical protein [Parasporobacterium sp.]
MGEDVLEYDVPLEEDLLKCARLEISCRERILEDEEKSRTDVPAGTRVEHRIFGTGTVGGCRRCRRLRSTV